MNEQQNWSGEYRVLFGDLRYERPSSKELTILKFWKLVWEIHGPLSATYKASKKRAESFLIQIKYNKWRSEPEARNHIQMDRDGALSLVYVTLEKASREGWDVSLPGVAAAKMPQTILNEEEFGRSDAVIFAMHALTTFQESPLTPCGYNSSVTP